MAAPVKSSHTAFKQSVSHSFFFFNDTATTEIYTLSLHDALPEALAPCWYYPVPYYTYPWYMVVPSKRLGVITNDRRSGCQHGNLDDARHAQAAAGRAVPQSHPRCCLRGVSPLDDAEGDRAVRPGVHDQRSVLRPHGGDVRPRVGAAGVSREYR